MTKGKPMSLTPLVTLHPRRTLNGSWWATEPETFYTRARAEVDRMAGSPEARRLGDQCSVDKVRVKE